MKITAVKIKKELVKSHGWAECTANSVFANELIKDTLKVIDEILMKQKGISIK